VRCVSLVGRPLNPETDDDGRLDDRTAAVLLGISVPGNLIPSFITSHSDNFMPDETRF
jgi:hypothetical protein